MLLEELIKFKHYKFAEEAKDWREAIRMSCEPLEADGSVTADYKEEVIQEIEQYGPYIIIMPNVAIPHAQEYTDSVKKTSVSFLKLKKPVCFTEDGQAENTVQNFFTFASCDAAKHIDNLSSLMELLMNSEFVKEFELLTSEQDLKKLQKKWEGRSRSNV